MRQCPQFRGYTVDLRLRQFRRVLVGADGQPHGLSCIDFGLELLTAFVQELLSGKEAG